MNRSKINRRGFLTAGALGFLGAGAFSAAGEEEDGPRIRKFNTLGKTGIKVPDISMGVAREPAVYHYALDLGVNLIDTAESYYDGQHEIEVGKTFKGMRDKVNIITKHHLSPAKPPSKKELIERFDASLKRLQSDYVDIAMMHMLEDPALLKNEEILGAYEELKKAGKYRHLGFSTHDAEKICPPAFESELFSCMMVIYNSVQYPERSDNIKKAKELGIGVIAMKTMMGREQDKIAELVNDRNTFSQAAIKWALTDECVKNVVITMKTFEHIEEYLQASGKSLTPEEKKVLKKYAMAVDDKYCRIGCTACHDRCPNGVAVNDVMRFGMYFENYGDEKKAMMEYAALDRSRRASPCHDCDGPCESACPHGLAIGGRLRRYDALLS